MMTDAPRTMFEKIEETKIRYLRREQEERDARRAMRDFLRDSKDLDDIEDELWDGRCSH